MKKLLFPLWFALVLACGFTGCGAPTYITSGMRIELAAIERAGDGTVRVNWRVANPNVAAYVLARSTHKLSLNGTPVGTFSDSNRVGVPAQNAVERSGVLTLANAAAGSIVEQAAAHGSAAYQLDSAVFILMDDEKTEKIPMSGSGTVPVTTK
ncbi:MAG TPA: LEA type 2 family protein [Lacunisphaera sp.]|nr:LEA type 2 family protein [Lacunisphaera sp.]